MTTGVETPETIRAERDTLKAALRDAEARLRTITELFPVQRYSVDASGIILTFEGLAVTRLGLRPEKYIGRSLEDALAHNPTAVMHLRRALLGKEICWGVPPEIVERTDVLAEELHNASGEPHSAHSIDGIYPEGHDNEQWQAGYCVPLMSSYVQWAASGGSGDLWA